MITESPVNRLFQSGKKVIIDLRHTHTKILKFLTFSVCFREAKVNCATRKVQIRIFAEEFSGATVPIFSRNLVLPYSNNPQSYHAIHATVHLQCCASILTLPFVGP